VTIDSVTVTSPYVYRVCEKQALYILRLATWVAYNLGAFIVMSLFDKSHMVSFSFLW